MFQGLVVNRIRIHDKESKGIHYIPNVISIGPLEELIKSIEWLVADAEKDYSRTYKIIRNRRRHKGVSQQNLDDIDSLGTRIGSRTQNYINQICLAEDILIYEYERMARLVKTAGKRKFSFDAPKDYLSLKNSLRGIRKFRNKIVAHTAYTLPLTNADTGEIEDNPETVVCSILNLFPKSGNVMMGNNFFSGFRTQSPDFPILSIFEWDLNVKPVFIKWNEIFIKRLQKLHLKCTFETERFKIDIHMPHKVTRFNSK